MPTEAEILQVDSFEGDALSLADCDQFVLLMGTAPGYDLRLKSILFKNSYKIDIDDLNSKIFKFFSAFDFIKKSEKLHKWFELILAFGNYLNGQSNRGGAYGYKLDSLIKISDLKSTDNKKTLLTYLVEYVYDNKMEDTLTITRQLEDLAKRKIYHNFILSLFIYYN